MRTFALMSAASLLVLSQVAAAAETKAQKIPITTSSEEARALFLEGRDLLDKLRAKEAHDKYEAAVGKDPKFALAHLGLAQSATSAQEFFDAVTKAQEYA